MNQETVDTMYDKLDELRDVFEDYLNEHDNSAGERKVKEVIKNLAHCIEILKIEQ